MAFSFSDLIAPLKTNTFYERFWERSALFLPRNTPDYFDSVLTLRDLDCYLTRSDLRYPALRLIRSDAHISPAEYTTNLSLGSYSTSELIRSDRVLAHYCAGATILVQLAHLSLPTLRPLAASLEKFFNFNVEMNVYLTPPGCQGFAPHFDTHSVCVLQLSGAKTWYLHSQRTQQPLLEDKFSIERDAPGSVEEEVVLQPGSFLYVPRGRFHSARANSEPSLHLTIGLFPPTWLDLLQAHLSRVANEPLLRKAPSPLDYGVAKELAAGFGASFDVETVKNALAHKLYTSESQPAEGRLLDILGSTDLKTTTLLRVRAEANIYVARLESGLQVKCFGVEIMFPPNASDAVATMLSKQGTFTPSEILSNLDSRGLLVLCKRLLTEGLLTLAQVGIPGAGDSNPT